jgi:hypothetical protein
MNRPLERLGIGALESLAEPLGISAKELTAIADELVHRSTLRASILSDKVKLKLKAFAPSKPNDIRDLAGTATPTQKGFAFEVPMFNPVELPQRQPKSLPATGAQPVPVVLPALGQYGAKSPETAPVEMSVEQAYRVLKVTPASSWDVIEASRRGLVARAQPDRLAGLDPAKRKALQDEAHVVNIAYKTLLQPRS